MLKLFLKKQKTFVKNLIFEKTKNMSYSVYILQDVVETFQLKFRDFSKNLIF